MNEAVKTIEELMEEATAAIFALFEAGRVAICAFSAGKDSSCVALLALHAAKKAVAAGLNPILIVSTSDTLIDNPEVTRLYSMEHRKMREYGMEHGFEVITQVVTPNLASTWQVNVLQGRSLPSFPGEDAKCSEDMKVNPQAVFRNQLLSSLEKETGVEACTCVGTRFEESEKRAVNMKERGESATVPTRNKDGHLILSPIANWTTDDVWEMIGYAASGLIDTYSTFDDTKRIYAAAENSSCAVIADAITSGRKRKAGCSSRTGCVICQMAEDKSLENMVLNDSRYHYAKGLVKLNKFIRNTRYDWSRRHWLGRVVKGGYLGLQPHTYHPKMLRSLARYMMQLDYDEQARAREASEVPMFQLLTPEMLVAIDAHWSLYGNARPFAIWADYRDIHENGVRYDIPDVEESKIVTKLPTMRFLYVGEDTDDFSGLRDAYIEALTNPEMKQIKDSDRMIWDVPTSDKFTVDPESAFMLMMFEMNSMVAKYNAPQVPGGVTMAYKWYASYGAIQITSGKVHDETLRRTELKDRLGLTYDYDVRELLGRSVDFGSLPAEAMKEWAGAGSSSQGDMFLENLYDEIAPRIDITESVSA